MIAVFWSRVTLTWKTPVELNRHFTEFLPKKETEVDPGRDIERMDTAWVDVCLRV